jgi:hypothetical protein
MNANEDRKALQEAKSVSPIVRGNRVVAVPGSVRGLLVGLLGLGLLLSRLPT